jgi:hypothetical protein
MYLKVEYNTPPNYIIEEFILDIHNCVDTPHVSLRNRQKDVVVRPTKTCSLIMEYKWLEDNTFEDH